MTIETQGLQKQIDEYGEKYFLQSMALIKDRTKKLDEVAGYLDLFYTADATLEYSPEIYVHKKMKTSSETAPEALHFALEILENFPTDQEWNVENLKNIFIEKIKAGGYKNGFILFPLRVALSGEEFSPGTLELLEIFGKQRSITRITRGIEICEK